MGRIKEYLKDQGYNLRERLNIYSGTLIGAAMPVTFLRYLMFQGDLTPKTTSQEIFAWAAPFLYTCIPIPPFFIGYWAAGGAAVGVMCARQLRRARETRESKLEKQV